MSEKDSPRLIENDVNAYCPVCDGRSNFVRESGAFSLTSKTLNKYYGLFTGSITFLLLKCVTCSLGALGIIYEDLDSEIKVLVDFYPKVKKITKLPDDTPEDISSEFKSAENCANIEEYRPAATMLRSTIEKVLNNHGYNEWRLSDNLKNLQKDRLITAPLARKNKLVVKILGDQVLHQKWREVDEKEYLTAREYALDLIKAFYSDVEGVALERERLKKEKETSIRKRKSTRAGIK